jgi:hypothetical protein
LRTHSNIRIDEAKGSEWAHADDLGRSSKPVKVTHRHTQFFVIIGLKIKGVKLVMIAQLRAVVTVDVPATLMESNSGAATRAVDA